MTALDHAVIHCSFKQYAHSRLLYTNFKPKSAYSPRPNWLWFLIQKPVIQKGNPFCDSMITGWASLKRQREKGISLSMPNHLATDKSVFSPFLHPSRAYTKNWPICKSPKTVEIRLWFCLSSELPSRWPSEIGFLFAASSSTPLFEE